MPLPVGLAAIVACLLAGISFARDAHAITPSEPGIEVYDENEAGADVGVGEKQLSPRGGGAGDSTAARRGPGGKFFKGYAEERFKANPAERTFWWDQSVRANTNIARINVQWFLVAPERPADATNPADPAYRWGTFDAAVREAAARGQRVLLTLYHAPAWAEGSGRPEPSAEWPPGTWKPRPSAFAQFARAAAERYSGKFTPAGSTTLPRVQYLGVWNEPNLTEYLTPQSVNGKLFAPRHYRKMVNKASAAVRRSTNPKAKLLAGATSPYGDNVGGRRTRPLRFFRDFLCLKKNHRPQKRCKGGKADFRVLAHHPITLSGGPNRSALHPDDVAMPDFKHVVRTLRAAERRGTVKGDRHPVWATEFWWSTNPPDSTNGVPLGKHARWVQRSLYSLWRQGASGAIWFQLADNPSSRIQGGHFFEDRTEKPAFQAFRFPFNAKRQNRKKVKVWTIAPGNGKVVVQRKRGKNWRKVKRFKVRSGVPKQTRVRVRGKAKFRAQLRGEASLPSGVKRR